MTEPLLIAGQNAVVVGAMNDDAYNHKAWAFTDALELVVKDTSSDDSISAVLLIAESKIILQSA